MQALKLKYKNSIINYYRFGKGKKTALCFHGYGETAASYLFLETLTGEEFNFIAIDLPFHGETDWKEGYHFSSQDLKQITTEILNEELQKKIILIGFSLGARIALSLYGLIPGKVEKILLLAPDGLKLNFWYWLATQTHLGNTLFSFTMKKPGWFFGFLKTLDRLKLVNASIFKFV